MSYVISTCDVFVTKSSDLITIPGRNLVPCYTHNVIQAYEMVFNLKFMFKHHVNFMIVILLWPPLRMAIIIDLVCHLYSSSG